MIILRASKNGATDFPEIRSDQKRIREALEGAEQEEQKEAVGEAWRKRKRSKGEKRDRGKVSRTGCKYHVLLFKDANPLLSPPPLPPSILPPSTLPPSILPPLSEYSSVILLASTADSLPKINSCGCCLYTSFPVSCSSSVSLRVCLCVLVHLSVRPSVSR